MIAELSTGNAANIATRLAIGEVVALVKVMKEASDGEFVKNWSYSTITNVLYAVERTERMVTLVDQAQRDSYSFAALLGHSPSNGNATSIEALRVVAIQSVQCLIEAMNQRINGVAELSPAS